MELTNKLSGKRITLVQMLISLVLICVIAVMSFGTIFTVGFELDEEMTESIENVIDEMAAEEDLDIEIRTEIDVDLKFMIKSISSVGDVLRVVTDAAKDINDDPMNADGEQIMEDITERLLDQDFIDFIVLIVLVFGSFAQNIFLGLGNLLLLAMTFILPITAIIAVIRGLIGVFFNTHDIGRGLHKVSRAFFSLIAQLPLILLVLVMVPGIRMGTGVYGIMICCLLGLIVNFIGSRTKYYEGQDLRYINIVQIVCTVSLVGYVLFFFNFLNSGIMNAAYSTLAKQVAEEVGQAIGGDKSVDAVPIIMTLLLLIAVISVLDNLTRIVTRIACMSKGKSAVSIGNAVISLLVIALPVVMKNMDINFEIDENCMSAFTLTSVGVFIMAAAEILLAILLKKLCPAVSVKRGQEIVTGAYYFVPAAEPEQSVVPATVPDMETTPVYPVIPEEPVLVQPYIEESPAEADPDAPSFENAAQETD